jgi:antitoxin component YwqK of YwqJK toxin-antitoxin module
MKSMIKSLLTNKACLLIACSILLIGYACKPSVDKPAAIAPALEDDISGLVREKIPGTSIEYARQLNAAGAIEIEGFLDGNQKTGQWIRYNPEGDIIQINNFVNGKLEGMAMKMSFRNQVDLKMSYKQGEMDGSWTAFKFGKVIEERNYVSGKLEGTVKVYDQKTFKVKQETQFKSGVQDGSLKYFDENGNVVLSYEYKNGEKIGGGIVEPPK